MFTVYDNPNYGNVLVKDDKETFCPFQPPIPMPTENGGFTIMRLPCSTNCPHANIADNKFKITCGCEIKVFNFEWQDDEKEKIFSMKKV